MKEPLDMLTRLQAEAGEVYKEEMRSHEFDKKLAEVREKQSKTAIAKAIKAKDSDAVDDLRDAYMNDEELRPEAHGVDTRYLNTGFIPNPDTTSKFGLEAAAVTGPFSLQGEYFFASAESNQAGFDDADFDGGYIFGSWFMTGESRKYKKGTFGRVSPKSVVGRGGMGAWELAARYSYGNLDDGDVEGGEETNYTIGLNWYATKYVRFMANYVYVDAVPVATLTAGAQNVEDKPSIYQMRAQIDF